MESSILLRKTISSSPNAGHGWEGGFVGAFFLWGKRLLPWRFADLAIVPRGLPDDKETGSDRRLCPALWLLLGSRAADKARCNPGVDALSSAGTDEKAESDFSHSFKLQEGGQLSPCADREPYTALRARFELIGIFCVQLTQSRK